MRKWEKAESACRDRRIVRAENGKRLKEHVEIDEEVHAENGKRLKAHVGIGKWYVRKAGRGENRM